MARNLVWGGSLIALALSLAKLMATALGLPVLHGLPAQILTLYEQVLSSTIGELLRVVTSLAQRYVGWNLEAAAEGRHVFVLMGIYFFRIASVDAAAGSAVVAWFQRSLGFLLALASSLAVGTLVYARGEHDLLSDLLIATVPILAIYVFDLCMDMWSPLFESRAYQQHLEDLAGRTIPESPPRVLLLDSFVRLTSNVILALVVIAALSILPPVRQLASPGLFMLGVYVFYIAVDFLRLGYLQAAFLHRNGRGPFLRLFARSDLVRVGALMLFGFVTSFGYLALALLLQRGSSAP